MRYIKESKGYYVTENGKVYREVIKYDELGATTRKKQMASVKDKKGYIIVPIYMLNGSRVSKKVHRLVASTYIPNPYRFPQVNHKDLDKSNNSISNLEWVTNKKNMEHAVKNGVFKGPRIGRRKPITIEGVEYESITIASEKTGIPISSVSRMAKYGDKWRARMKKYHTKKYRAKHCSTASKSIICSGGASAPSFKEII